MFPRASMLPSFLTLLRDAVLEKPVLAADTEQTEGKFPARVLFLRESQAVRVAGQLVKKKFHTEPRGGMRSIKAGRFLCQG